MDNNVIKDVEKEDSISLCCRFLHILVQMDRGSISQARDGSLMFLKLVLGNING